MDGHTKRLIEKHEKERRALHQTRAAADARIAQLQDAIDALRRLNGVAVAGRTGSRNSTGTKALILDVLQDGTRRSCKDIAAAVKAKAPAVVKHLAELVANGDITREGKSRATTYGVR